MAEQLTGKSIQELAQAPALFDTTNLIVQREGSLRAEKTQLKEISDYVIKSKLATDSIQAAANLISTTKVTAHGSATDPHGDRAYTDSLVNSHLVGNDPHGDKLYTDSKIALHNSSDDPHGDRNYTDSQIVYHNNALDPHGDRANTSEQISEHAMSLDPHGDRSYSLSLMLDHNQVAIDPHGDRGYTDTVLNDHKGDEDAHGLRTLITELLIQHEEDITSHSLDQKLSNLDDTIKAVVEQNIAQKVGTVLPPLQFGKVPQEYLNNEVVIDNFVSFPAQGQEDVLYIDSSSKTAYIWSGSSYLSIIGSSGGMDSISTDEVAEGTNLDRRYFTRAFEATLNGKINSVVNTGSGTKLTNPLMTTDGQVFLKSLKSKGILNITDEGDTVVLNTNDYNFTAAFNEDVKLSTDTTILENIDYNDTVVINGTISAINYQAAGNMRLLNYYNSWKVNAILATTGTSTSITPPSNIVISSNGLVITGQSIPTATIEIYSIGNVLLGSAVSLTEGSFTVVLNSEQLRGDLLKAYTVTAEGNRSEPFYFYTKNTTEIKKLSAISINPAGNKIRGNTSRGAQVSIKNLSNVEIGLGSSDINGNFAIDLSSPVITGDTLAITATVGTTLTDVVSDYVVALKNIEAPYSISTNLEHTVIKGKAEPNSVVTFRFNEKTYKTTTNAQGLFTFYSFVTPVNVTSELIFTVTQDERKTTTAIKLEELTNKLSDDPIVNNIVSTFTTTFILKTITPILGSTTNAGLDLLFNNVTREIEVLGDNKDGKQVYWDGILNIVKYSTSDIEEIISE